MKRSFRAKLISAGVVALVWAASSTVAESAKPKHHPCALGNGYADGCAGAPVDGNYINKAFFSLAKQSGQQKYYRAPSAPSDHPPPWNVAGVDYPVGYPMSRKLKDPAVAPLPAGCNYSATGSYNGGAIVVCNRQGNLAINGWDFGLHNCTNLYFKGSSPGTITIKNSRFVNGTNCSAENGYLAMVETGSPANFVFERNFVDGNAKAFPASLIGMIVPFVSGNLTLRYNAFLNSPARPVVSNSAGALLVAYNYWQGFLFDLAQGGHGEVLMSWVGDNPITQPSLVYSFNTGLEPNDVCVCGTAMWYAVTGGALTTIQAVQIDHNTSIVNTNNGEVTVAAAAAETANSTYGTVLFQQNYIDPTGSYGCFLSTGNPTYQTSPVFMDNVNMLNGSAVTVFGNC